MANKYTRTIDSQLLANKIDALSRVLQQSLSDPSVSTREELVAEAANILSSFYRELGGPIFNPHLIQPGDPPDTEQFNKELQSILDDLNILFTELENIESLVLENFNYFVSESNRLSRRTKSIASKVGDYALFSRNLLKNSLYVSDSFNNLEKVDFNSDLLNSTQCQINQAEGVITLPVIQTPESVISVDKEPVINTNSNGVRGNNLELGTDLNNNIKALIDNNADTWFEYERVVPLDGDDNIPLTLDLTINLESPQVINFIRINPNNFGTKTQVEISSIETSIDGSSFVSVKDEVPVPGFETEDEENVFTLAPSTSKYAGQGLYTFTPRKAKYIHVVLIQRTPYVINTATGQMLRYAIGLRDIILEAQRYETKGELVSREFITTDEVRKIFVESSQNPSEESELASITHQISPDNGISWYSIRPGEFTGITNAVNEVPEILNFNTNLEGDISTQDPVTRIRYRAVLERDPAAFLPEASSSLKKRIGFTTELRQIPSSSPFTVNLEKNPLKGTVQVIDPQLGSRGIEGYDYELSVGNTGEQIHNLPFKNIQTDLEKNLESGVYYIEETSPEIILVNNKQWTKSLLSSAGPSDKVYEIDYSRGIVRFGDGTNGQAPPTGSIIAVRFTPERMLLEPSSEGRRHNLKFPTNGDKKTITITKFDDIVSSSEALDKSTKKFVLNNSNLVENSEVFLPDTQSTFTDKKTYIDGIQELVDVGDYSVDYESGIIYSFSRTPATNSISVTYQYEPQVELDEFDWYFSDETTLKDTVIIRESAFSTIEKKGEAVPDSVNKFSVSNFNLERGSIQFIVPTGTDTPFVEEVDFIDGRTEILGLVQATEKIPAGTIAAAGLSSFDLTIEPVSPSVAPVTFSNTDVFSTSVTGTPSADGEYRVTGKTVEVYTDAAVTNPGSVTYFYQDPTVDPSGRYSVDYELGNVYTNDLTPSGIGMDYEYAKFEISYPIARGVPSEDVEVNDEEATVTLSDREVLRRAQISSAVDKETLSRDTYQILYNFVEENREDLTELEPYFSPILKDYVLRILTKGNLL